jgi:acylphosphatase
MDRVRAHVFVRGLVQGVNFRWYTTEQARRLGLGGWVRNLPDGRVEAVLEGAEPTVKEMIEWLGQGPRHARVDGVDVEWEDPEGLFEFDFEF